MTAYLDSNVFAYAALYEGEKADGARRLLREVVEGSREAATASLTLDEVTYVLEREETREGALRQAERVLGFANLRVVSVGAGEARSARCATTKRFRHATRSTSPPRRKQTPTFS